MEAWTLKGSGCTWTGRVIPTHSIFPAYAVWACANLAPCSLGGRPVPDLPFLCRFAGGERDCALYNMNKAFDDLLMGDDDDEAAPPMAQPSYQAYGHHPGQPPPPQPQSTGE